MLWADDEEGDGQVNCEEFVRACWYPSEGGVRSSHPAPTLLSSGKADSASFPQLPLSSFPPLPPPSPANPGASITPAPKGLALHRQWAEDPPSCTDPSVHGERS